jgi:hypothetical protein
LHDFKPADPSGSAVYVITCLIRGGINPWLVYLSKSDSSPTFPIKFTREDFSPNGYKAPYRKCGNEPGRSGWRTEDVEQFTGSEIAQHPSDLTPVFDRSSFEGRFVSFMLFRADVRNLKIYFKSIFRFLSRQAPSK